MGAWLSHPVVVNSLLSRHESRGGSKLKIKNYVNNHHTNPHLLDQLQSIYKDDVLEAETLVAIALQYAFQRAQDFLAPELLYDCRTFTSVNCPAPTYKILAEVGFNNTIPLSLHGQGGTEPVQATKLFLCKKDSKHKVSALSGLHWPTQFGYSSKQKLAVAAMLANKKPPDRSLKLIDSRVFRHSIEQHSAISQLIEDVIKYSEFNGLDLKWTIIHKGLIDVEKTVKNTLPNLIHYERSIYKNSNLSCCDLLISISELMPILPQGLPGILVSAGLFNTIAISIVIPED